MKYLSRSLMAIVLLSFFFCSQRTAEKPNIIFLLTDDHRWDALGVMGNPIIKTPNIDKLAREGVMFRNAYVTTAICAVSRASILTGQYMSRHKMDNGTEAMVEENTAGS